MNICKDVGVTKIGLKDTYTILTKFSYGWYILKNIRKQFLIEFFAKTQKFFKVHKSEGFLDVNPPSTLTNELI